jgi:hypothetical protein
MQTIVVFGTQEDCVRRFRNLRSEAARLFLRRAVSPAGCSEGDAKLHPSRSGCCAERP